MPFEYNSEGERLSLSWEPIQFNPADFQASSGSWNVVAANVPTFQYALIGVNIALLDLFVTGSSITGTPGALFLRLPFTTLRPFLLAGAVGNPGGVLTHMWVAQDETQTNRIQIRPFSGNNGGLTDLGFQCFLMV